MKEEYFLIPLTSNSAYIDGKCLNDILKETYPELSIREIFKTRLLHSTKVIGFGPKIKEDLAKCSKYIAETSEMYRQMNVPEYLIAYGNKSCIKEVLTDKVITDKDYIISLQSVTKERAQQYYNDCNYKNIIRNFLKDAMIVNESPFEDFECIIAHISGTLNGEQVEGEFKGKIKIKQK